MNYKSILNVIGKTLFVEGVLLLVPMIISFVAKENNYMAFLIPILICLLLGGASYVFTGKEKTIYAKEGMVVVAGVWIFMSLIGALPFVLSGQIPNYIDALFETVSGFTTTGASILSDVECLSKSITFWRIFTHWIGGMGVLVFVLAIIPNYDEGVIHIFRAESPGPSAQKFVSKLKFTARILYGLYLVLTVLEMIFLLCGGMSLWESVLHSFSTAGTGGFGLKNDSVASYGTYTQMVIAVFMFLFGINFNIFYLFVIGGFAKAFKSEELRIYFIVTVLATVIIAVNILSIAGNFSDAVRLSFFQVTSIGSSTGLSTADFNEWPSLSKSILILLMVMGACGGSTGGGMKVSRMIILVKSSYADVRKMVNPRTVLGVKFEKEPMKDEMVKTIRAYFFIWVLIVIICTILLCIDINDIWSNFTGTLACIGNTGPGYGLVGATGNYSMYSPYSKVLLSFVMLAGRLEIFPILILFFPRTWKRA